MARFALEREVVKAIAAYPATLLLGPRQSGKTTLAHAIARSRKAAYFDLEDPETSLTEETLAVRLRSLRGLVIIDECQRLPGIFNLLRVFADRRPPPARFLLLGSASPELVRGASQSLAGRAAYVEMSGFTLDEIGRGGMENLWLRGGFPPSFLARTEALSYYWRLNFIQSFLERDLPQLGIRVPAAALRRFWAMLAHLHGCVWNAADLARSMGVKEDTARHYLDILTGSFMLRQLQPWFENSGKRLVKAPKVYFRDTGVLHALLSLRAEADIKAHPKLGLSWEGFALEETLRLCGAGRDCYFYKTHSGAELDLFLMRGAKRYGFEFKYGDAPVPTKSMHVAAKDLRLDRLWVIYPGSRAYPLGDRMEAMPLAQASPLLKRL